MTYLSHFGTYQNRSVNSITEATTIYTNVTTATNSDFENMDISVFPNPSSDLIAIQINGLVSEDMKVELFDIAGKLVSSTQINEGQTIAYFDVQTLYAGTYLVNISNGKDTLVNKVVISR